MHLSFWSFLMHLYSQNEIISTPPLIHWLPNKRFFQKVSHLQSTKQDRRPSGTFSNCQHIRICSLSGTNSSDVDSLVFKTSQKERGEKRGASACLLVCLFDTLLLIWTSSGRTNWILFALQWCEVLMECFLINGPRSKSHRMKSSSNLCKTVGNRHA